ncbi:MAG: MmgE/PrpD family protein [Xanthobacteraceae bacterium]
MSVIGELASFVCGAKASALPESEQQRLRLHLTDTVVAALAGACIPEGEALGTCADAGALADRIGRRAAAARLTEIDDIHLPSCTTPSAGAVPVALALAASTQNFDPDELASAIWAGVEITTRIGLAVDGAKILYRGIWPTYLAAPVAAAATAARMLGLDVERASHALSLALMLAAGGVGRIGGAPSGRWFLYAKAVAGGVAAAQAARAGCRGDPELLDKEWLADTHGIALDRARLTEGLPQKSVYSSLSLKPFCSAKQAIAAVEAFRGIVGAANIGIEEKTQAIQEIQKNQKIEHIKKIQVRVPSAYAGMIGRRAEPGERQSTMVSVAHQIALAAIAPQRLYDVDRSMPVADGQDMKHVMEHVVQLAAKVEVAADSALDAFYPQHWPAEVEVDVSGQTFRRRVVAAEGDPEHPLGRSAIDDKAHRVLDPLIGAERVDDWLTMCHGALDGSSECRRLVAAFAQAANVDSAPLAAKQ